MEALHSRNPVARACAHRVQESSNSGLAFDASDIIPPIRALQAKRICERFTVSFELALTVAALVYEGRAAR